jgi:hypothetical protein
MIRLLLDADPAAAGGGGGQPPAPPSTPKQVAKTPIKTPNEIRLEKVVAGLEDKVGTLEEGLRSVNTFLEELNIGGASTPTPVKVKAGKVAPSADPVQQTPSTPASDDSLDAFIWGKGKV